MMCNDLKLQFGLLFVISMAAQQHRQPQQNAPVHTSLNSLLAKSQALLQEINNLDPVPANEEDEQPIRGKIYDALLRDNDIATYTNLTSDNLIDFYQTMLPFIANAGTRGPKTKSSWMDHLLCYLVWGKLGEDYQIIEKIFNIKQNHFEANLDRVRPLINQTLRYRWWTPRPRPRFEDASRFPHVALLLDHHTSQTFRPKAPFEEGKIYWDGKNKVYGYKNLVGVMATAPHYCLFTLDHEVASKHDYQDLKDKYQLMLDYLHKTPEEMLHLQGDVRARFWGTIEDRAYVGPETDTPDFRRITPKKGRLTPAQRVVNKEIDTFRVPIEQFFGRLLQLWAVPREIYS
jgi:hypothetical protein